MSNPAEYLAQQSVAVLPGESGVGQLLERGRGMAGLHWCLDASSDLLNWTAATNLVSTSAGMSFLHSSATNYSRRFYRAVVP